MSNFSLTTSIKQQVPGVYHRKLGEAVITTLLDGYLDLPKELFSGVTTEHEADLTPESIRPDGYRVLMNSFLINLNGKLTIIDPGSSIYAEPSLGVLMDNLKAVGISPDQIDTVLLTHIHPDHSYGLLDENGGKAFKNAEVVVHDTELQFWLDDRHASQLHPIFQKTFELTNKAYLLYKDKFRTFNKEEEVLPGIFAIESPGHTLGHTSFLIQSEGEKLLIWGDTVHIPEIEVRTPQVKFLMDIDPALSLQSRIKIFDLASDQKLLVGAMHAHFPGYGYVRKTADSYRFLPEPWQSKL